MWRTRESPFLRSDGRRSRFRQTRRGRRRAAVAPAALSGEDTRWYAAGLGFRCARSGGCCSGKGSVVRLSAREIEALANHLRMTVPAFRAEHTRESVGETVLRDVKGSGDCEWLERHRDGTTGCRVNDAKPDQCRTYPFWPRVLRDAESWEHQGRSCRGIGHGPAIPADEIDRRAGLDRFREALETLLAEVDAEVRALAPVCFVSGACCDFPRAGHRLYVSQPEAERLARGVDLAAWDPASGLCPAWKDRRCTAREHRPLACRTYFCDPNTEEPTRQMTERYVEALKALHERHRVPWDYGDVLAHLSALRGENALSAPGPFAENDR